jgi:hypothetical protein
MILFRQKDFTIQEGHFTGTKDEDKLPGAVEVIGKSAIGGAIIGAIVGKFRKKSSPGKGALEGAKYGALTGIALKILINYLHKPMSRVKYQEVDKGIRREYGIYKAGGLILGDKLDKRASMEERFAFNDRNVCAYKICFAVQDNQVTMYTFNITDEELEKINNHLDHYCKEYFGMEYDAFLINQKANSYSVGITFTNYQVISNFMVELSEILQTKINLLDSSALVKGRLEEESQKSFSVQPLNKYDLMKILGKNGARVVISGGFNLRGLGRFVLSTISDALKTVSSKDLINSGIPVPRQNYGNTYLEDTLKKLHYIEGFNYSVGDKDVENNISMAQGLFLVTVKKGSDEMKKVDKNYWESMKSKIRRADTGRVIVYTYSFNSKSEFELLLKKLMQSKIMFNIFEG